MTYDGGGMPPDMRLALVLLSAIYIVAVVQALLVSTLLGFLTAAVGFVVLVLVIVTHGCLTSGDCSRLAWMYVFLYAAILITAIVLVALFACMKMRYNSTSGSGGTWHTLPQKKAEVTRSRAPPPPRRRWSDDDDKMWVPRNENESYPRPVVDNIDE